MHIINAMFGKKLGGIEQAFLDYTQALLLKNNKVTAITNPKAQINTLTDSIKNKNLTTIKIKNRGQWDFIAICKIRKLLKANKPDAIIAHGNRAISLMSKAGRGICPVIGLAHNYNIKRLKNLDAAFVITNDLQKIVEKSGQNKIFKIPNMIDIAQKKLQIKPFRKPVIIGTMGRFVPKKGFICFIKALSELKKQNIEFRAIIGGSGEQEEELKALCDELTLNEYINFIGWVVEKKQFWQNIDIFCLPSIHEPFGIVLLEAFAAQKPIITTDSEGPSEIANNNIDALIIKKNNHFELAEAFKKLIQDEDKARKISQAGYKNVCNNYAIENVAHKINNALEAIVYNE